MTLGHDERWELIDRIAERTVSFGAYELTIGDVIGELTVKPLTGIPVAFAVLYAFWSLFTTVAGSLITDGFMTPLFNGYFLPWLQQVWPDPQSLLYFLFVGVPGARDSLEAFGVLTSGLYVAIGIVLPAVLVFYLLMTLLEDTGYLPRLAVLVDSFLHKIGLHGYAIVPTILGLGCNVPAITSTRILETKKQRFIMMTLVAIFIPCGAQLGIMRDVIPETIGWVFIYLFVGYCLFGYVLNRIIPGENPEILIDVPRYHMPALDNVASKMWMRTRGFLIEAIPFVLGGILFVNLLYAGGVIQWLAEVTAPLFVTWFGVPKETVGPLISAFLRKDLAIAQLSTIPMTPYEMISAVVLVTIYFPCVATFVVMLKEGVKELLAAIVVLFSVAFIYGGIIHGIGILLGVTS